MQATATRGGKGGAPAADAPRPMRPFRVGVQSVDEIDYDDTRATTVSTQDLPVLNIPPAGWLRGLYIIMIGTTAGNAAAVTFAANGPWNAIDSVTFEDVNTQPIIGPLNGYDLYVLCKFGGYTFSEDPRNSVSFSVTTGAGATGGSFQFILRVPIELVNRDALGVLPNKSGTAQYKLRIRLAATATIYGVAPTAAPSVRTRVQQVNWWDPDATDLHGNPIAQEPPSRQTTQYWTKAPFSLNAGQIRQPLERTGFLIRNLIFMLQDSTLARTDADFPDPFALQFESNILISRVRLLWQHIMSQQYGYTGTADAAGALSTGVFVEPFCLDFGARPGQETRRGYLETSAASRLEAQGTIGGAGAHTLTVLTNDVNPSTSYADLTA